MGKGLGNGMTEIDRFQTKSEPLTRENVIDYFGMGKDAGKHSFLSNFYEHGGWTVEHHYQAAKTDDADWAAKILKAPNPTVAKKLGRLAPVRRGWDDHKVHVMRTLLRLKFSSPELALSLLDTGNAQLVEGNWWGDTFWGQCNGVGENWLGRLLMDQRLLLASTGVDVSPARSKIYDEVAQEVLGL